MVTDRWSHLALVLHLIDDGLAIINTGKGAVLVVDLTAIVFRFTEAEALNDVDYEHSFSPSCRLLI